MKLEIVLTPRARDTFIAAIIFIKAKWGDKTAEKFVNKTYKTLDTIAQQPYIFQAHLEAGVRKGLITKHASVVYRVFADRIEILYFWDNRQEPII